MGDCWIFICVLLDVVLVLVLVLIIWFVLILLEFWWGVILLKLIGIVFVFVVCKL